MFLLIGCNVENNAQIAVDLNSIELGTSISDMIEQLGEPVQDIGSGLHILMYTYNDDEMMLLNFNMNKELVRLKMVKKSDI